MRAFVLAVLVAGGAAAQAAERLVVEACAYPDGASAAAAWRPVEDAAPVSLAPERTPDGRPALAFRCDMDRLEQRAHWDRQAALQLARYGRIAFWVKGVGDATAIGHSSLYFNAGGGWYGATFGPPGAAWQRIVLDRGAFAPEGAPEGWHAIQAIRIAFWKAQPRTITVYLGPIEAIGTDVVVVRNARAGGEAQSFAEQTADLLVRAGIDAGTVDDVDVEGGVLEGKRIAVYPLNPRPSERELDAVEAFVRAGGRLLVCYTLHPRLAALLGVEDAGYQRSEYPGQFSRWRFAGWRPPGLPTEVRQASWNIQRVRPVGRGARVLAEWHDAAGKPTGCPAIVLSDTGAYISHVLLRDDAENKQRVVAALLGHLQPAIWEAVARDAVMRAGQISKWSTFAEAVSGLSEWAKRSGRSALAARELAAARRAYAAAEAHRRARRHAAVLEPAAEAARRLQAAYALCQPAREGEFRGVWCHSAYGVEGMTWDQAIRRLKESGFNAVVPNMLWGGVADYPSAVLPVRDSVARQGDQIALCVAAARRHGVEVHVWKVNWNLAGAPKEFVDRMRAEGRLQRTDTGEEEAWLCPSHPANFALERDSMLEVVRRYDVDGIHFDYIRYPDQSKCYCDGCRERFEASTGIRVAEWPRDVVRGGPHFAAYQEFRRSNITRLVKAVSEEARRLKPWVKISAAVFSDWPQCREHVGQDWGEWVKQGYLDFVCPMDYTAYDEGFRSRVQVQRDEVAGRVPLYPGVGASAPGLPVSQVMDQVQIARAEGADGFILFNYDGTVARDYVPALGRGATRGATHLPHNAPEVRWTVQQRGQAAAGALSTRDAITVGALLTTQGRFRQPARGAEAVLSVTMADGTPVQTLGRVVAGGAEARAEVRLRPGLYRLVVHGQMTLADGSRRPFTARGPFLRVGP